MPSARPVPGATPEPPVRGGELLRHLTDPRETRNSLTVAGLVLVLAAVIAIGFGFGADYPANLYVILGLVGFMLVIWFLAYRPARARLAGDAGPDARIALLVVPEGLVTHGGLDVHWREIAAVHIDEREYRGKGVDVRVVVRLNTGDVRDRATGGQRRPFTSFGRALDARLGRLPKASRQRTTTVLREQCDRNGVPFSTERRVLSTPS